jgi:hypothetical protein
LIQVAKKYVYNTASSWSLLVFPYKVFDTEIKHETPTTALAPDVHQAHRHRGSRGSPGKLHPKAEQHRTD